MQKDYKNVTTETEKNDEENVHVHNFQSLF